MHRLSEFLASLMVEAVTEAVNKHGLKVVGDYRDSIAKDVESHVHGDFQGTSGHAHFVVLVFPRMNARHPILLVTLHAPVVHRLISKWRFAKRCVLCGIQAAGAMRVFCPLALPAVSGILPGP